MFYSAIIVDDEHLIRSSLTKKVNDFEPVLAVGAAANGIKCLEWLSKWHADICITDVRMPHMDGLELLRRLNAEYPWMVFIVVSSYEDFTYVRTSMHLNAVDYVMKPVDQRVLNDALSAAVKKLERSRRLEALSIVMKKLPFHEELLQSWIEMIRTLQTERMYVLIAETLLTFDRWVGKQYHLLNELAVVWLEIVLERINQDRTIIELPECRLEELGKKPIPLDQKRLFFRVVAVGRLEYGVKWIFEVMRTMKAQAIHPSVEAAKQYLQQHYAEKINLQDIAEAVAMSKTYLANLFKQETGSTIWNCLVEIRMQHARELLLSSNLKGYEIASRVGYENSIHFSKLFKEQYGLNPMEYKKRMQG